MPQPITREMTVARLVVRAGDGRLARHRSALLFVPPSTENSPTNTVAVDELVTAFLDHRRSMAALDEGRTVDPLDAAAFIRDTTVPFVMIDWSTLSSPPGGSWPSGSTARVLVSGAQTVELGHDTARIAGRADEIVDSLIDLGGHTSTNVSPLAATSGSRDVLSEPATDLIAGVVPAGSFVLELSTHPSSTPTVGRAWFDSAAAVAPPSVSEVGQRDNTLAPDVSVSWPDEPATGDSTLRRAPRAPRHSAAAVQLPDGRSVPVLEPLVIGRDPDATSARVTGAATLVPLGEASTVSRTHVVVRASEATEPGDVVVVDCGSRGRTALVRRDQPEPAALPAWIPTATNIGDTILLGGPTAIAIIAGTAPDDRDTTLTPASSPSPTPGVT